VLTSSAAAASPLRYRDLRAAYASSCHRPTSSAARATSEVIHLAVSRAFPGGHHDHAVVGPILHVEEAGERRGELGSVRHGCPEEIGRLAMVVTSVAVTQADATGGIGGGATGEYGEPCGNIVNSSRDRSSRTTEATSRSARAVARRVRASCLLHAVVRKVSGTQLVDVLRPPCGLNRGGSHRSGQDGGHGVDDVLRSPWSSFTGERWVHQQHVHVAVDVAVTTGRRTEGTGV